jgi:predicted ATPase
MTWLEGISARSLRHIDRLEIVLKGARHLILIGPNGSGKSILLEAIVDELSAAIEGRPHPAESVVDTGDPEKLDREMRFAHFGRPLRLRWTRPEKDVARAFDASRMIAAYLPDTRESRVEAPTVGRPIDTDPKLPRVRAGGQLGSLLLSRKTEERLGRESGDRMRASVHEAWFVRVQSALRRLLHQRELTMRDDRDGMHLDLPDGRRMHFDELSRGHAAAVAIWAEIMMRVEAARLRNDDPALSPSGVVVIDGPEMELDVRLQRDLMPGLAELYPNVSLVLATHSPLVAMSLDDAIVFDLTRKRARRSEELRREGVDGLLGQMFGRVEVPRSLMSHPPPKVRTSPPPKSVPPPVHVSPPPKSVPPLPRAPNVLMPASSDTIPMELSTEDTTVPGRKANEPPKKASAPPPAAIPPKQKPKRPMKQTLTGSGPWTGGRDDE